MELIQRAMRQLHNIEQIVPKREQGNVMTLIDDLGRWIKAREEGGPHIDVVFDGPPSHKPPGFVEVEDSSGRGMRYGEWVERSDGYWVERPDGYWVLRIPRG